MIEDNVENINKISNIVPVIINCVNEKYLQSLQLFSKWW